MSDWDNVPRDGMTRPEAQAAIDAAKSDEDRRRAWDVAQSEPDGDACDRIVDAIFATLGTTRAHSVEVKGGKVEITYNNGFGPTVAVDDVIERMTVAGWKKVCCETMRRLLLKCGRGDLVQRSLRAKAYPTVTLVPEDGAPIIAAVKLSMWMPRHVRDALEGPRKETK